jgi:hypothetical protein
MQMNQGVAGKSLFGSLTGAIISKRNEYFNNQLTVKQMAVKR